MHTGIRHAADAGSGLAAGVGNDRRSQRIHVTDCTRRNCAHRVDSPARGVHGPDRAERAAGHRGASTAKISIGQKKLAGHVVATVRVGEDGRVREVLVTENTAEAGSSRSSSRCCRVRVSGRRSTPPASRSKASVEMKVELRQSTAAEPKPVPPSPTPARRQGKGAHQADALFGFRLGVESHPGRGGRWRRHRIHAAHRHLHVCRHAHRGRRICRCPKSWKAAPKALREAAEPCEENPGAPFWDGVFKGVMDEAVPK